MFDDFLHQLVSGSLLSWGWRFNVGEHWWVKNIRLDWPTVMLLCDGRGDEDDSSGAGVGSSDVVKAIILRRRPTP